MKKTSIDGWSTLMSCLKDVKGSDGRHLQRMDGKEQGIYTMNKQSRGGKSF